MSRGVTTLKPELFVKCWETAPTVFDAIRMLSVHAGRHLTNRSVLDRVAAFREQGVDLKVMELPDVSLTRSEVRRLNALISAIH